MTAHAYDEDIIGRGAVATRLPAEVVGIGSSRGMRRPDTATGVPLPSAITVTTDAALGAAAAAVADARRHVGLAVEQRSFVPTAPDDGRPARLLLLASAAPVRALAALVAPPTAPPAVVAALSAVLFPPAGHLGPATLQLKAPGVFVSVVAADGADLRAALSQVGAQVVPGGGWGPQETRERERRVVYVRGTWEVCAG